MYQIFNEDCLEGMKRIETGTVDAIICDPPYGITACAWDVRIPFEPMWEQFKRVTKRNAAIVLFSQMPFGAELIMSNRKMFRYDLIWEKNQGMGFFNANRMPLRAHENILVFYQQLPTYNPQWIFAEPYVRKHKNYPGGVYQPYPRQPTINDGKRYPRSVQKFNSQICYGTVHPTQKPIDLMEYLIRTYTDEGETVLDATMGSGSTGVACMNTNRRFIGFETEQKFFDIAKKRIDEAIAKQQQSLF